MRIVATQVDGAVVVEPEFRVDARGGFARLFCRAEFAAHGLDEHIEQANLSTNREAGTVRGLHYQLPPHAETKLVRCIRGALFDVAVDLRPDSPTFGRWDGVELTADNHLALLVPRGCAHGFQTLVHDTTALYHVSAAYAPEHERGVHHLDPDIGIAWPSPINVVSERDANLPSFSDADKVTLTATDGGSPALG